MLLFTREMNYAGSDQTGPRHGARERKDAVLPGDECTSPGGDRPHPVRGVHYPARQELSCQALWVLRRVWVRGTGLSIRFKILSPRAKAN